jgi:hypothetical protein
MALQVGWRLENAGFDLFTLPLAASEGQARGIEAAMLRSLARAFDAIDAVTEDASVVVMSMATTEPDGPGEAEGWRR